MTTRTFAWDGVSATETARRLGLENVWMHAEVESTQDEAHKLAEQGVPAGALVVADAQRTGRGRHGRNWSSLPGQGVWCTIVERPTDVPALDVLTIRIGLRLAASLDQFAGDTVRLKWPNDLVVPSATTVFPNEVRNLQLSKLAGVLVEARWSGPKPSWVAVGVGVNVSEAGVEGAIGLRPGTPRFEVLRAIVTAVRSAAAATGTLSAHEVSAFAERDALAGRRIVSPGEGVVVGIDASGALLVRGARGVESHRSGTIRLAEDTST